MKVCRYPEVFFNCHVFPFFETSDLKEVRILFLSAEYKCNGNIKVPK